MLFATFSPLPLRLFLRLSRFLLTRSHWFRYVFLCLSPPRAPRELDFPWTSQFPNTFSGYPSFNDSRSRHIGVRLLRRRVFHKFYLGMVNQRVLDIFRAPEAQFHHFATWPRMIACLLGKANPTQLTRYRFRQESGTVPRLPLSEPAVLATAPPTSSPTPKAHRPAPLPNMRPAPLDPVPCLWWRLAPFRATPDLGGLP